MNETGDLALRTIASWECENYTGADCQKANRGSPYAEFSADRWCAGCIARAGLDGPLPRPIICIDASEGADVPALMEKE